MENTYKFIQFTELNDNISGEGFDIDLWNTGYEGCNCELSSVDENKVCSDLKCLCINRTNDHGNYDKLKKLNVNFEDQNWHINLYPIYECNFECNCNETNCLNRVVQLGLVYDIELFDCSSILKGKGIRTKELIPKGSFVIAYTGELIGIDHAKKLLKQRTDLNEPNYIMFLKEFYSNKQLMQTTVIDARNYSNLARFINHSCDPNLFVLPVRIENVVPHAALFSLRDIKPNEELSYDYNGTIGSLKNNDDILNGLNQTTIASNRIKCFCGSSNCKGYLPDSE